MMTLDEAIIHCQKQAEKLSHEVIYTDTDRIKKVDHDCLECAKEHEQLANWLKELKQLRENKSRWEQDAYTYRVPVPNNYITTIDNGSKMLECPKCKCRIQYEPFTYAVGNNGFRFCPYCGEDVRKEGD